MKREIFAFIPARGGSKSIPHKNIQLLDGQPLISYSIALARSCPSISRVFVSTDSPKIQKIAIQSGAEAPFLRPEEISQDHSLDIDAFMHWLDFLKSNDISSPECIVHLRPTSPLRTVAMVENCIAKLLADPSADSVRTVCEPRQNPFKMWQVEKGRLRPLLKLDEINEPYNQPRQLLPKVYWQTAAVDVIRTRTILEKKSMTGEKILAEIIPAEFSIDIDDQIDWELAEIYLRKQRVHEK